MSSRSGLPVNSLIARCRAPNAPGNPSSIRSAPYARIRLASPATAFASCSTSGRRVATPISAPGNDAKPPKPRTTSGGAAGTRARRRRTPRPARTDRAASPPSPLPRTPRKQTLSKSTPCCGTSFASIPSRVPSQNTRAPRVDSFCATARPGNTWPPVPPVVIITVAIIWGLPEARSLASPEGARASEAACGARVVPPARRAALAARPEGARALEAALSAPRRDHAQRACARLALRGTRRVTAVRRRV